MNVFFAEFFYVIGWFLSAIPALFIRMLGFTPYWFYE